jgi:hypothetical protein
MQIAKEILPTGMVTPVPKRDKKVKLVESGLTERHQQTEWKGLQ